MASGYTSRSVLKSATSQAVAASQTKQVVSEVFSLSPRDADSFRADLTISGHSGTVSAMVQTSHNGSTWIDGKAVSITGNGNASILYNLNVAGDQAYLPLAPICRICVTTAGASGATVDAAWVATRI